jgi:hypothetical protein
MLNKLDPRPSFLIGVFLFMLPMVVGVRTVCHQNHAPSRLLDHGGSLDHPTPLLMMPPFVSEVQQKLMELSCVAYWLFLVVSMSEGTLGQDHLEDVKVHLHFFFGGQLQHGQDDHCQVVSSCGLGGYSKLWCRPLSITTLHDAMV